MDPIKFEECNTVVAKDQPQYLPLHAHKTKDGILTSCWKLSFKECIKLIFTQRIYLQMLTFNTPLQPVKILVDKPDFPPFGMPTTSSTKKGS